MCVYIQEFKKNIKYSFIKILRNVWKILEKFKNQKIKKKIICFSHEVSHLSSYII